MHDVLRKDIKGKEIQETSTLVDTDNMPIENMSLQEVYDSNGTLIWCDRDTIAILITFHVGVLVIMIDPTWIMIAYKKQKVTNDN